MNTEFSDGLLKIIGTNRDEIGSEELRELIQMIQPLADQYVFAGKMRCKVVEFVDWRRVKENQNKGGYTEWLTTTEKPWETVRRIRLNTDVNTDRDKATNIYSA